MHYFANKFNFTIGIYEFERTQPKLNESKGDSRIKRAQI